MEEKINYDLLKYWMEKVSSIIDDEQFDKDNNYYKNTTLGSLTEDVFRWYK